MAHLTPLLRERLLRPFRSNRFSRFFLLRRLTAVALILLAAILALWPSAPDLQIENTPRKTVVVAAQDISPGNSVGPHDVALREIPAELAPEETLHETSAAIGRVITSGVRRGEMLTDTRFIDTASTALVKGVDTNATVPVRLADREVAGLLTPGSKVDIIAADSVRQGEPSVLAIGATVIAVLPNSENREAHGRLVAISLPRHEAARVAAAALSREVTVTLRR